MSHVAWYPQQLVNLLKRDDLMVWTFNMEYLDDILDDLENQENIGLATLFQETKVDFLCLTAKKRIYVFDLKDKVHCRHLKGLFKMQNLRFFTRDGSFDAERIRETMKINISERDNFYDLTSVDLYLRLYEYRMNHRDMILTSEDLHRGGPIQRTYQQMVQLRLGAHNLDLKSSKAELTALREHHPDELADNCVKKKCALTAVLASDLWESFNRPIEKKSKDLYSMARRADNQLMASYYTHRTGHYAQFCHYLQSCPRE